MNKNPNETANRITRAFVSSGNEINTAREIAFHITDWRQDLEELVRVYDQSQDLNDEQIRKIIIKFLAHVPNHVAAAKKLVGLGPIEDIFEVGVLDEDDQENQHTEPC